MTTAPDLAHPTSSDWVATRGEKWSARLNDMESMLAPIDAPLLDALRIDGPHVSGPLRIADVGCGGGGTTFGAARRAPAGSVVHGWDISPKLVETARARLPESGVADRVTFDVADMATHVPTAPYDRVVARFSVMFFTDPAAGFAGLARWLAPGGRFALAVWGPPADNAWMASAREAVGRVIALPAMDPALPGPFRYAGATALVALLEGAGLTGIEVNDWRGKLPLGAGLSPDETAGVALASFAALAESLAEAGEAATEAARRALAETYARHVEDGVVRMDARVHLVTGGVDRR